MNLDNRVIVAGAGPVGLLVALALARQDVPVVVLEAAPGLTRDLRAGTFHPPSLEMMAPYGITDEMHKVGLPVRYWQLRDRQEGVIAQWDLDLLRDETPYPYRLHLEQHRLTPILYDRVKGMRNVEIRFGSPVVDVGQDADRAWVTVEIRRRQGARRGRMGGRLRRRAQHGAEAAGRRDGRLECRQAADFTLAT